MNKCWLAIFTQSLGKPKERRKKKKREQNQRQRTKGTLDMKKETRYEEGGKKEERKEK